MDIFSVLMNHEEQKKKSVEKLCLFLAFFFCLARHSAHCVWMCDALNWTIVKIMTIPFIHRKHDYVHFWETSTPRYKCTQWGTAYEHIWIFFSFLFEDKLITNDIALSNLNELTLNYSVLEFRKMHTIVETECSIIIHHSVWMKTKLPCNM